MSRIKDYSKGNGKDIYMPPDATASSIHKSGEYSLLPLHPF